MRGREMTEAHLNEAQKECDGISCGDNVSGQVFVETVTDLIAAVRRLREALNHYGEERDEARRLAKDLLRRVFYQNRSGPGDEKEWWADWQARYPWLKEEASG